MNVRFKRRFLKELAKVPASPRKEVETFVFEKLPAAKTLSELENLEAMKGYHGFYKVRFGDWRLGLRFEKDTLSVERILHRKEIYRYFP